MQLWTTQPAWLGGACHHGLYADFLCTFYGGTLFFDLQFSWITTSHLALNMIAISPPMPMHWTLSTSTRRIVRSIRYWQWHLLSAVKDASCWPPWWCAWCLLLYLINSHLHVRVLSLSVCFVRALCACSVTNRISGTTFTKEYVCLSYILGLLPKIETQPISLEIERK